MSNYIYVPIDRTTIKSKLRLHPALFEDPNAFIRDHLITARTIKPGKGKCRGLSTQKLTLDVLAYKGIKLELKKYSYDPLTHVAIDFNPGRCLYGHNGSILSVRELMDALGLLINHISPLLLDSRDWLDIVPGLRAGGCAYWDYVEIPIHAADPDGKLFEAYRNMRHPKKTMATRHWATSMSIGSNKGELKIAVYRKANEMVAHNKLHNKHASDYQHILRLEARMRGGKLVEYMGNNRNTELIDGVDRLVRFHPLDIANCVREVFGSVSGVYASAEQQEIKPNAQLEPIGRLLAHVTMDPRTSKTLPELVAHIKQYTEASGDTMSEIRHAGEAELSRHSSIRFEDIFLDAACRSQQGIANVELEDKVFHDIGDVFKHPLLAKAYLPPSQYFVPVSPWPTYHKH